MPRPAWQAMHFRSESAEQRRAIVVSLARTMTGPWFFADLSPQLLEAGFRANAGEGEPPRVMTPELFPGNAAPAVYADALSAMTARALLLIEERRDNAQTAAAELDALYRACFARVAERHAAAEWHAEWLRAKTGESGVLTENIEGGSASPFDANLARRIRAWACRLTGATMPAAASLVARLAHIHTLRLLDGQPERARAVELAWTTSRRPWL